VKKCEETKRECGAEKQARTFTVYKLIHKNKVQNMNKVDIGKDTILLTCARFAVKQTGFLKVLVFHLCLTITKIGYGKETLSPIQHEIIYHLVITGQGL
jgi:hypothetical protein